MNISLRRKKFELFAGVPRFGVERRSAGMTASECYLFYQEFRNRTAWHVPKEESNTGQGSWWGNAM
jgi:hypothetical protein